LPRNKRFVRCLRAAWALELSPLQHLLREEKRIERVQLAGVQTNIDVIAETVAEAAAEAATGTGIAETSGGTVTVAAGGTQEVAPAVQTFGKETLATPATPATSATSVTSAAITAAAAAAAAPTPGVEEAGSVARKTGPVGIAAVAVAVTAQTVAETETEIETEAEIET
jgi:hypothetical protein